MRKLVLVGLVLSGIILPDIVRAGGIPVFDSVNLSQQITGYVQNLMDYSQQLQHAATMGNQYATQLQQYERELEEYQHFLEQIQALGPILSEADWEKLRKQTITYYGDGSFAAIPHINVTTEQGRTDIQTVLQTAYEIPSSVESTITQWQARIPGYQMPAGERTRHAKDHVQMQRLVDRQVAVAANRAGIEERAVLIDKFGTAAYRLGDDSHLQTQHLIAQQMNFLLQQQEIQAAQLNQLIASQETMSEFAASKAAEAREQVKRQMEKYRKNRMPSTLGSDLWKSL